MVAKRCYHFLSLLHPTLCFLYHISMQAIIKPTMQKRSILIRRVTSLEQCLLFLPKQINRKSPQQCKLSQEK